MKNVAKNIFSFLLMLLGLQFFIINNSYSAKNKVVESSFFDAELFSLAKKTESAFDSASSIVPSCCIKSFLDIKKFWSANIRYFRDIFLISELFFTASSM